METAFRLLIGAHECLMFGEANLGEDLSVWSPPHAVWERRPRGPPTYTPLGGKRSRIISLYEVRETRRDGLRWSVSSSSP